MKTYEAMFLIDNAKAGDWDSVVEHVHGILKKRGSQVISTEKWGERKLAYRIKGHRRGTYMQIYFDAPVGAITEVRRDCQLSDVVLRNLILKAGKRPELGEQKPVVESSSADEAREPASDSETEEKKTSAESGIKE
ncbi:MAG: 30S ribosomal protein S6 [Candidatus Brocadiales bacterium]|nr:30S ribosomal protein S6 [Candidatus Bathyanammoxibius sp.]MCQ4574677.1 30S ribosomal protein S6 [Candidatus Bathyanammoxibius amoris]